MPRREARPVHVTITRHANAAGERCRSGDPGARPRKCQSDSYYAWLLIDGRRQRVALGTRDEGEAWAKLRELQVGAERRRLGITDRYTDAGAAEFAACVADLEAYLGAKGTTAKEVGTVGSRLRRLGALAGWRLLRDVTAGSALAALSQLQRLPEPGTASAGRGGRSARTRNHYLRHLRQLVGWLIDEGRLKESPLRRLRPVPVEGDLRHERRCPEDAEVRRLFRHLASRACPVRRHMGGRQRALGYRVAMAAGLRADELRTLTRESFDLRAGAVTVQAGYSKRRRRDTIQLPGWLVEELKIWFASGGGCWATLATANPGDTLKQDLKRAGVPRTVRGPGGNLLYFDMHSLRVWYCTQVAGQPGIDPRTLMELCRHSTPTLTLKVYAKVQGDRVRKAVARIARPGGSR